MGYRIMYAAREDNFWASSVKQGKAYLPPSKEYSAKLLYMPVECTSWLRQILLSILTGSCRG